MHKCSKCGRAATSLEEIDAGCPCGSKVFVFDRQIAHAVTASGVPEGNGNPAIIGTAENIVGESPAPISAGGNGTSAAAGVGAPATFAIPETAKDRLQGMPEMQAGKVPPSQSARVSFASEDIENIKVLTQGVFLLDVNAISKSPVVLKDEDEIYYVKLPLVQKKSPAPEPAPLQGNEGNGKL
jgi:predicted  nucleic acid-binding Zn-ribbon protein